MSSAKEEQVSAHILECRRNGIIQPLLTDLYEFTMAYGYWKAGKSEEYAVFDLFFRKNPFDGEFTIFAGLKECLKFLENFHFTESDIEYLKSTLHVADEKFWRYMQQLTPKDIKVYAIDEGNVVFPRVPLLRVEGPVVVAQLLETVLLNLVNFASLVATNAARHRLAAGKDAQIYEMGLRRAQGPDGGLSASKYSYLGGTDGTSNTLAGKMYGIPVVGTHAHSFVASFTSCDAIIDRMLRHKQTGEEMDFIQKCQKWHHSVTELLKLAPGESSEGELAAFASYALAFPEKFVALVDTYDTIKSGIPNFCSVALALNDFGYRPIGIRLDSGDLAYLSLVARDVFRKVASKYDFDWFSSLTIMASNNINEETLLSLRDQGHSIDTFGIGTNLVTCQKQPALGGVYKLVQLNEEPKVKLSETIEKVTLPGRKTPYRLYGSDGYKALVDLMVHDTEPVPEKGKKILCRHPFHESKRAWVVPGRVEPLYKLYWDKGKVCQVLPSLEEKRQRVTEALESLRLDHKRVLNPTPYKVAVSGKLYQFIHELWLQNAPIGQLQ